MEEKYKVFQEILDFVYKNPKRWSSVVLRAIERKITGFDRQDLRIFFEEMLSIGLLKENSQQEISLTEIGLDCLGTEGGYSVFNKLIENKKEKESRHLDLQISLALKRNWMFWIISLIGIIGGIMGFATFIQNNMSPAQQKLAPIPQHTHPQKQKLHIDEKSTPQIHDLDSSNVQPIEK